MTRFALPELHVEVRQAALRFAREGLATHAEAIDGGEPIPETIRTQLAELGFWGIATAEDRGGIGLDALAYVLVVEALATGCPSVARRVAVHAGPALAGLARTGADLEPFCTGERFATYVAGLTPAPAAAYVTEGGVAETASVEPVDPMGHRGAGLARVSAEPLTPFAKDGPSPRVWHDLGLAAVALGSARAAMDAAIAYGKERKQFGRPLTDFQAIRWKIADGVLAIDAAELLVQRAATSLSATEAALARAMAVRAGLSATDDALQIHGGYGYTCEYPVERHLRSVRMVGGVDAARVAVAAERLGV